MSHAAPWLQTANIHNSEAITDQPMALANKLTHCQELLLDPELHLFMLRIHPKQANRGGTGDPKTER